MRAGLCNCYFMALGFIQNYKIIVLVAPQMTHLYE